MTIPPFLQALFEPWFLFLSQDPLLRVVQVGMLLAGVIAVFLVFYTTRDILLRTSSFLYMFLCILLVAFIPVIGFFVYLLIRPARTIKERELEQAVRSFMEKQPSKKKAQATADQEKK